MIINFEDVENIKLIDCSMYKEYSVLILFKNGDTFIKDLDTSEEAQKLYNTLYQQFQQFKEQVTQDVASV